MTKKEYNLFKSAQKTAKENNLTITKDWNNSNILFDFTLLNDMKITDFEKNCIINDALKHVCASNKEQFYIHEIDNFTVCEGIAYYTCHKVYNVSGKHLYNIMQLNNIKHKHGERKTVYEQYYNVTETVKNNGYYVPSYDYEIA